MTSSWAPLDVLFKVTLTPSSYSGYLTSREISLLIDQFTNPDYMPPASLPFTKEQAEATIDFILRLVNTPQTLKGALWARQPVKYLLECACKEAEVSTADCETLLLIADFWFKALEQSTLDKRGKYLKIPFLEESALLRFHMDAISESSIADEPLATLYSAYAYLLHKKIRRNEQQPAKAGTHLTYVRSARYFFKYTSLDIKARKGHPSPIPQEYVQSFLRGYDIDTDANYDGPLSDAALKYELLFKDLLAERPISSRPHGGTSSVGGHDSGEKNVLIVSPPDGRVQVLSPDGELPVIVATELKIEEEPDDESDSEGDGDVFETSVPAVMYTPPSSGALAKKPSLGKRFEDLINLRNYHFFWDSNYLNLFHYGLLYLSMSSFWNKNAYFDSIIVFIAFLIHTGITPRNLIDLRRSPSRSGSDSLLLDEGPDSCDLIIPSPVMFKKTPNYVNCSGISTSVRLRLPTLLRNMVKQVLSHGGAYVFSFKNVGGKLTRITLDDIMVFLQERVNDPFRERHIRITPVRIAKSFLPLYHHRFGLDPIICCYISGKDRQRLYSAQMHYIHVERTRLSSEHMRTFRMVNDAIIANLSHCLKENFFTLPDGFEDIDHGPFKAVYDHDFSENKDGPGYGSPLACSDDFIRTLVKRLGDAVYNESDLLQRHNIYTAYSYLCLQFSTGLRPRNRPDILWIDFDETAPSITIRDKQSALYNEQRALILPRVMTALLSGLRKGVQSLKSHVAAMIRPAILNDPLEHIFFFVDPKNGHIVDFTLKRFREVVQGIGAEYDLPLNMPRHYLRNYLYHADLSNDLADFWMGHQHSGKEVLNITSTTVIADTFRLGVREIEDMLKKIGFAAPPYLPARWNRSIG